MYVHVNRCYPNGKASDRDRKCLTLDLSFSLELWFHKLKYYILTQKTEIWGDMVECRHDALIYIYEKQNMFHNILGLIVYWNKDMNLFWLLMYNNIYMITALQEPDKITEYYEYRSIYIKTFSTGLLLCLLKTWNPIYIYQVWHFPGFFEKKLFWYSLAIFLSGRPGNNRYICHRGSRLKKLNTLDSYLPYIFIRE